MIEFLELFFAMVSGSINERNLLTGNSLRWFPLPFEAKKELLSSEFSFEDHGDMFDSIQASFNPKTFDPSTSFESPGKIIIAIPVGDSFYETKSKIWAGS